MPEVVTVFSGDTVQSLTGGVLLSTAHKVKLNTRERVFDALESGNGLDHRGASARTAAQFGQHLPSF